MQKSACDRDLFKSLVIRGASGVTIVLASACNNNASQTTDDSNGSPALLPCNNAR